MEVAYKINLHDYDGDVIYYTDYWVCEGEEEWEFTPQELEDYVYMCVGNSFDWSYLTVEKQYHKNR